jgi:hypothetical protein
MKYHKALPVKGYADMQHQETIDLVDEGKELEERVLRYFEKVSKNITDEAKGGVLKGDPRWISIARTHVQQGFMASTRAIFNPQRIMLPEDPQRIKLPEDD